MTFHFITLFFLNAIYAMVPLGFRSRIGKISAVLAAAFGLTNLDFNHLPYSAPGWAATALPAAGIVLLFAAFLLEIIHRRASTLSR